MDKFIKGLPDKLHTKIDMLGITYLEGKTKELF